jgi:hypothetical protein
MRGVAVPAGPLEIVMAITTPAVRNLARAWLRVIWCTAADLGPCDPSLRGNAVALVSGQAG